MNQQNQIIAILRKYESQDDRRSWRILGSTLLLFAFLIAIGALVSYVFPLAILVFSLPVAILLCRLFALQHDLGHRSFFTNRKWNQFGSAIVGFITMVPGKMWKRLHDNHHGHVGNLDKRKQNAEVWTLTVEEYQKSPLGKKILYRIARSILVRLIITPVLWIVVARVPFWQMGPKIMMTIFLHDLLYAAVAYTVHVNGWWFQAFWLYLLPIYLFMVFASWLFYVQHQYENTSWENDASWSLYTASIYGSSYLDLGSFLRWMTGDVGCHHIHHLNPNIPFYHLRDATENADQILRVERLHLRDMWKQLTLCLWDTERKKMVSIRSLYLSPKE